MIVLKTLNSKLKLPAGWKYRWKVLDRDMGIHAIEGTAQIVRTIWKAPTMPASCKPVKLRQLQP